MKSVCKSVVTEVVADCRHAHSKGIKFAQVGEVHNVSLSKEEVAHLKNIHSVHVIVVLNFAMVSFVNLADKTRKFCLVHLGKFVDFEYLQDVHRNDW